MPYVTDWIRSIRMRHYRIEITDLAEKDLEKRKQIILNANIYVLQDDQVIVQPADTPLYRCLVAKYYEINQRNPSGGFYKTDLFVPGLRNRLSNFIDNYLI